MEQQTFESLIGRMEALASARPAAYRRRVLALALLGYGYLALVLLVLLALSVLLVFYMKTAAAVAVRLFFLVAAPLVLVVRAMWVRGKAPAGERLTREQVPELFSLLDALSGRLKTPALDVVLLVPDFNAGVTQVPRLGMLCGYRTYLIIGLPLMKALTVEQFQAVLAHELGHLSRGHARSATWIYRLRLIWSRMDAAFTQNRQWGSRPIRAFFKWYIPYFSAISFPLARANEYEADAASIQLTSARSVAQALTAVNVFGSYWSQHYWPGIQAAAKESAKPAAAPFSHFTASAIHALPGTELQRWQQTALAHTTTYADTHPSLTDRLKAIGAAAEFAPPAEGQSAESLLGAARAPLAEALDRQWRERVAGAWNKVHEQAQKDRERLNALRLKSADASLDEMAAVELTNLEESVGDGPAVALVMRRALVERYPQSLPARFVLARQLLQGGEAEGVAPMQSVIAANPEAVLAGTQLLRDYHSRRGEAHLAQQWQTRFLDQTKLLQAARQEREHFRLGDPLHPHNLPTEVLGELVTRLKSTPGLTCAYLVRKSTQHFPDKPVYVLAFRSGHLWTFGNRGRARAIQQRLVGQVKLPGTVIVVNLEASNPRFTRRIRRMKGARIV